MDFGSTKWFVLSKTGLTELLGPLVMWIRLSSVGTVFVIPWMFTLFTLSSVSVCLVR